MWNQFRNGNLLRNAQFWQIDNFDDRVIIKNYYNTNYYNNKSSNMIPINIIFFMMHILFMIQYFQ